MARTVSRAIGGDIEKGAFVAPILFHCADPDAASAVHETEAFGPVSAIMGYRDLDHAIVLANRGQGSLVVSVITHDPEVARADAAYGAWWTRARGRRRGTWRHSWRETLYAAMQRTAVQGGSAVLDALS